MTEQSKYLLKMRKLKTTYLLITNLQVELMCYINNLLQLKVRLLKHRQEKQLSKQEEKHIEKHVEKHVDQKVAKHVEKHVEKTLSKQLLTKAEFLGHQFKQHVSTAIIAAFSFLIALAWKDLIVHFINTYITTEVLQQAPYLPALISALVVTLIAITGILAVTTWAKKPQVLTSETSTSQYEKER